MPLLYEPETPGVMTQVRCGEIELEARLSVHGSAESVILFAQSHGSGLSNSFDMQLAARFGAAGFGTMLMDLYTPRELEEDLRGGHLRFAIRMLAQRLDAALAWLGEQPGTRSARIGIMGASTGAAAAMVAAAMRPQAVATVVCRGGRPDLAGPMLSKVTAPTLLIVGGQDYVVADFNRAAMELLTPDRHLLLVPRASHQFDEPGAIEAVGTAALNWFSRHLALPAAIAS